MKKEEKRRSTREAIKAMAVGTSPVRPVSYRRMTVVARATFDARTPYEARHVKSLARQLERLAREQGTEIIIEVFEEGRKA